MPLPNVRFKFQGLGATYKAPDQEGEDHTYSFVFRPISPVEALDADELPEDWQAQKVWIRFKVPSWNTHFDAKNFFKLCGIDPTGLSREQANEAFKRAKPVIEATIKRRSWTDQATGMQKWDHNLTKITLAGRAVTAGVAATTAAGRGAQADED
jgi:hypothetical protein